MSTDPIANVMAQLQVIAEAAVGYRRTLISGGISDAVADQLTVDWHNAVLDAMRAGAVNAVKGVRR